MDARTQLERRLGHSFADRELLDLALTHRSGVDPGTKSSSNERLEFLGDRVLGLSVASLLYETFPGEDEGSLAKRFAALVSAVTLDRIATDLDIASSIVLGPNETLPPSGMSAIAGNACEAMIGAVFLDAGFDAARACVVRLWTPLVESAVAPPKDAKTELQEWAQGQGLPLPEYRLIETSGPDHAPVFRMSADVKGQKPTEGTGSSKREATQAAAVAMLAQVL
jgi:ribonuclease-3